MSKYYRVENVQELINACEWRMTLAKERHGEGFVDYSKQVLDVDELTKRLAALPTIEVMEYPQVEGITPTLVTTEVSEDCISKEYVLDKLNEQYKVNRFEEHNDMANIGINQAESIVQDAPSVVPSRAEGKWLFKRMTDDYHIIGQCSLCKELRRIGNYCPNCGAKMGGADDD